MPPRTGPPLRTDRVAALAAALAGLLWLAVGAHQRAAHGATQENEMRLVAGLTWMDTGKLLVLAGPLLAPAVLALARRSPGSRAARAGRIVGLVALAVFTVGTAMQFGTFPWGSYALTFEEAGAVVALGGIAQGLSAVALAVAFPMLTAPLARRRVGWGALAALLGLGGVAAFFLSPASLLPGVAWLGLAVGVAGVTRTAGPGA